MAQKVLRDLRLIIISYKEKTKWTRKVRTFTTRKLAGHSLASPSQKILRVNICVLTHSNRIDRYSFTHEIRYSLG